MMKHFKREFFLLVCTIRQMILGLVPLVVLIGLHRYLFF